MRVCVYYIFHFVKLQPFAKIIKLIFSTLMYTQHCRLTEKHRIGVCVCVDSHNIF